MADNWIKDNPFLAWILAVALSIITSVSISTAVATTVTKAYVDTEYSDKLDDISNNLDDIKIIMQRATGYDIEKDSTIQWARKQK